jgi:AcrR family transcriptional regulator
LPKIVNHDEYRDKLVRESFELMAKRGYYSLSMRDLARALRISTGTLYHYFPSKLGLFEAILQTFATQEIHQKAADENPSANFREGIDALFASCERQEELWAKVLLVQVDAYREPDGKMLEIFNNVFVSNATGDYLSKVLHIDNSDVIDLFRALMLGIIVQRVISRKEIQWSVQ